VPGGNDPLAGQTLNLDIEVAGVREATAAEIEAGAVEGESLLTAPGGSEHRRPLPAMPHRPAGFPVVCT
jgi:FKBP-type peptidyl-prolyl cis-trans isomerase SlyD